MPHFTDFQDFDERCNIKWFHSILEQTPKVVGLKNLFVGTDGTGFSIYQGSLYYCRCVCKKIKKKHFVKVVAVSDLKEQLIYVQ